MGPPPHELCFYAPWAWRGRGIRNIWWLDMMGESEEVEKEEGRGVGLQFSLRFAPRRPPLDRTLFSLPVSALFALLGWSRDEQEPAVLAEDGGESMAAVAAVVIALAGKLLSDQRSRGRRLPPSSARARQIARPHALHGPNDGLRILSKEESLENVIHSASIGGAPVLAASYVAKATDMAGANAEEETEHGQSEKDQEVDQLGNIWLTLLEREQKLELRMLEYYGLKEQEAAARELESRLNAASTEARLLELKVQSLQEENQWLKAQVSELDGAKAKLASTKEKLGALKRRVQGEQDQATRAVAALRERVVELEKDRSDTARKLEAEVEELRAAKAGLEEVNSVLALRLRDAEQMASPVNLVLEEGVLEEANQLREANNRLLQQMEQLHSDHCAHVEELIYLKWVNACLRYELRNYHLAQPHQDAGGGHAAASAKDLSKSMSYRSSEKAKQLMLQYGDLGLDFDPHDLFSPVHESHDGDETREDDSGRTALSTPTPAKLAGGNKFKFLSGIKKLLASKRGHTGHRKSKKPSSEEAINLAMRWVSSHDVLDSNSSESASSCQQTPVSSVTTPGSGAGGEPGPTAVSEWRRLEAETTRSLSDVGEAYGHEVSKYHALRPDHPAELDEFHVPGKHEMRRYSDDFRSPEV